MAGRTLLALCCALLAGSVTAYPRLWLTTIPKSCGAHPQKPYGPHMPPKKDSGISFLVKSTSGAIAKATSGLCPGVNYTVTASWNKNFVHHAVMTTTKGRWAAPFLGPKCVISTISRSAGTSLTDTLIVPCGTAGQTILKVTHSHPAANYFYNQVTYNINTKCAARTCAKSG